MTKRSSNQEVDEVGEGQLAVQLRPYAVEQYNNDYGIDFIVNLTDEPDDEGDDRSQSVLSDHFFIQLKSTTRFDPETDTVHEDMEVRHLEQYIDQPIPVLLAIYDDSTEEIYWRVIQEYIWDDLNTEKPNWRSQQTVRIKISRNQIITDYERLEQAVNRTQSRITRRQQQGLNIGEGIAFTPDDFVELREHAKHERLSYRGHTLLIAQQNLKKGDEEEARESIAEILDVGYDDEATVKALFIQYFLRNPQKGEEAVEMAEFAHKAAELASELDLEVDRRLATIFQHVAGLFVFAEKRREKLATDRIQSVDGFGAPEFDYARNKTFAELLQNELGAMAGISQELAFLLENEEYYAYAVALTEVIDYLAARRQLQLLGKLDPTADGVKFEGDSIDDEEFEEVDIHPLVEQAEQLADFVPEPETEANLRKGIGLYYYYNRNPDTAVEYISEARDVAADNGDTAFEAHLNDDIQRMNKVPNPYDSSQYPDEEEEQDRQEMTETILKMQGISVDLENPPDPRESDSMTVMAHRAVEDADAETYYKHCEHLHVGYKPSPVGRMIGVGSFGMKHLWCQYSGLMSGVSLTNAFERFKTEHCEGCEHHCPRPDDWELTEEYAQKHAEDPDFKEAVKTYESALGGQPVPPSDERN
jgi:hypothetical protein